MSWGREYREKRIQTKLFTQKVVYMRSSRDHLSTGKLPTSESKLIFLVRVDFQIMEQILLYSSKAELQIWTFVVCSFDSTQFSLFHFCEWMKLLHFIYEVLLFSSTSVPCHYISLKLTKFGYLPLAVACFLKPLSRIHVNAPLRFIFFRLSCNGVE